MDAALTSVRQARAQHRHELRTLTYVTLDQANGGIVRNLSSRGIGVQVVAAVRPKQELRVRFELRYPRLQVETRAEVVWATFSGQCGIRFLDIPPVLQTHINQWIFGNLLEGISLHGNREESIFARPKEGGVPVPATPVNGDEGDGLIISPTPVNVIDLPMRREPPVEAALLENTIAVPGSVAEGSSQLDWIYQPLSGRTLAWTVDVLVVIASVLLFSLVFLSIVREAPPWPLASISAGVVVMAALYWTFSYLFAGASLGTKLARIVAGDANGNTPETRFR